MCDKVNGKHNLKVIYSSGMYGEYEVVRWCKDCGAVVVDMDFDGRTAPGRIRKMEFPKETSLNQAT